MQFVKTIVPIIRDTELNKKTEKKTVECLKQTNRSTYAS